MESLELQCQFKWDGWWSQEGCTVSSSGTSDGVRGAAVSVLAGVMEAGSIRNQTICSHGAYYKERIDHVKTPPKIKNRYFQLSKNKISRTQQWRLEICNFNQEYSIKYSGWLRKYIFVSKRLVCCMKGASMTMKKYFFAFLGKNKTKSYWHYVI